MYSSQYLPFGDILQLLAEMVYKIASADTNGVPRAIVPHQFGTVWLTNEPTSRKQDRNKWGRNAKFGSSMVHRKRRKRFIQELTAKPTSH